MVYETNSAAPVIVTAYNFSNVIGTTIDNYGRGAE